MEACIEALFTIDGETDKRKTQKMIRVLKGAISVSKSRTGEVIYHYNRHEKPALGRVMAKYDRDTYRSKVNIDSQKRDVLRKWNLVFGRQRKFCESIRGFDSMLLQALDVKDLMKYRHPDETDEEEEEEEEEVVVEETPKMPQITDPRKRRLGGRQTAPQGVVSTPVIAGVLPKLGGNTSLHNARIETEEEERARKELAVLEERKRKAALLPRFDKELMESYLNAQKTLHEDLMTRNALMKLKSSVDRDDVFFKYRLKTKLPDSASSLLQRIERERSMSVLTGGAASQSGGASGAGGTRPNTRSRLSTRQGPRGKSSKSSKSARSYKTEDGLEEAAHRLDRLSVTARDSSPTASQLSLPRLERAKTVHFS